MTSSTLGVSGTDSIGDGIFDKLTNVEVTKSIWDNARSLVAKPPALNIHNLCGQNVDLVLRAAVLRRSIDNVTGVFVSLTHFKKHMREYVRRHRVTHKNSAARYVS